MYDIEFNEKFQYKNPVLKYLEYSLNEGFESRPEQNINMRIRFDVKIHENDELSEASVDLTCEIGEKKADTPFYIRVVETSEFRWSDDVDAEELKMLLEINAPTLLLSFLRPIVAQVTAESPYTCVRIPFVCFSKGKKTYD